MDYLIVNWHRDDNDAYVYPKDKQVIMNLEKMIPDSYKKFSEVDKEAIEELGKLKINRTAFNNHLPVLCNYIDFFIENYDDDKELPVIFLNLKNAIDDARNALTTVEFQKLLYLRLFTGNLKMKIYRMVVEQYLIDVTVSKTTGRVYATEDDFTNADAARFQAVSMVMKIAIPIIEHYTMTSPYTKGVHTVDMITDIFKEIFNEIANIDDKTLIDMGSKLVNEEIANRKENAKAAAMAEYKERRARTTDRKERKRLDKEYNNPYAEAQDLMVKLYDYIYDRLKKHLINNRVLWMQQSALRGTTENSHQDLLLDKYVFYDNFFKFTMDQNVVAFLQSVIGQQLMRTIISTKYKKNPIQIDYERETDGYSAVDRFEQTLMKIDESRLIRINLSIKDMLEYYENNRETPITDEEISYYEQYPINDNEFRNYILDTMFAKVFNGFTELRCMSNRDKIKLAIIGKEYLSQCGYTQLPWLLTSTIHGKVSNRIVQNTKFIEDLKTTPAYNYVMDNVYPALQGYRPDLILEDISKILNNDYRHVSHYTPEITGEPIAFDRATIANEYLNFLLSA